MKIHRVDVQNFLSFGPVQTLDLTSTGLLLVQGHNHDDDVAESNGAGKSVLGEALFWGLFGRTMRGLRGDDVLNRRAPRECYVTVTGECHGMGFQITRARKCAANPCPLSFHVAGTDRTAGNDSAETQRRIEAFLGYGPDVFAYTVVFGQGNVWRFTALTDGERKTLLDQMLGMERLGRAHEHIKTEHHEAVEALAKAERNLEGARKAREVAKVLWRELRDERRRHVDEERQKLDQQMQRRQEQLDALPEPMATASNLVEDVAQLIEQAEAKRRTEEVVLRQLEQAHREAYGKDSVAANKTDACRAAKGALSRAEAGEACEACGNVMTTAQLKERRSRAKAELVAAVAASLEASKVVAEAARHVQRSRDRIEAADDIIRASRQAQARHQAVQGAQARREAIEEAMAGLRAQMEGLQRPKPTATERRAKEAAQNKQAVKAAIKAHKAAAKRVQHLTFWMQGFGPAGVKSHLLDHVCPVLTANAATYAQQLSSDLQVEFVSQSHTKTGKTLDKLELRVTNASGAPSYLGSSSGERRKVDIVVGLALQSIVQGDRSCNLAIFDEVFESLDEKSAEAVMGLLREQAKDRASVMVISHQDWLKAHFPHSLCVAKEGGFSRIEWS